MDYKKFEQECSIVDPRQEKKDLECQDILKSIPEVELKQLVRLGMPNDKKIVPIKDQIYKLFSPSPKDNKAVFKTCSHNPPCNLECLYGKYHGPEGKTDDIVKERILTKGGAVYDTIAYRLPDNFAKEPICATQEQRLAARQAAEMSEQPWYHGKKKKKKKHEMMEFTGPVKILVVEKEGLLTSYTAKRIHAGFIQISHMLIGAPIMCIFFYVLQFNTHYSTNLHVLLCTIAFQYCLPASILVRNKLCVSGSLMSSNHQFLNHMIFKSIAVILIIVCGYILWQWRFILPGTIFTKHAIVGYAACAFTVTEYVLCILMTLLMGLDRGFIIDCYLHILSMVAIVTSFISLQLGISNHYVFNYFIPFMHWQYWISSIMVLFTLTAVFRPCMDCLYHLHGYVYATVKCLYLLYRPHDPCTLRKQDVENPFNLAKPVTEEIQKLRDLATNPVKTAPAPKKIKKKKADKKKT